MRTLLGRPTKYETGCYVGKVFKSGIWNTQAASYNFLWMYPGHESAHMNPQLDCVMSHFYDSAL